ncbi:2-keto-4-pentenoate hydratase/2-oxohepta-3-ene-1,7-dioic acid hydratase (catechol pathway) [Serratia rubidaea]|uniref:2-keto-4-pentenoate hydratase/2-oxohepta-3-ene-1,7-dioic acid hydratase (Catechol pathway) n=1 Tax=Serratia rubidaea TaxID=61652 RepID=A0A4U9HJQ4_SERRU|nr:2-keto-4-pentenoate hydratase/2-oxohepta-3-ene-1,7-dioic acid hydratase (catechol pathway) [Serratia rubidaea]
MISASRWRSPKILARWHHEVELAVLIGTPLKQANEDRVARAIAGYGIALDLTLRDLQAGFKKAGQPWEKAKGFDGSCPISGFIPVAEFGDAQNAELTLNVNGEIRQQGNTRDMITPILPLIGLYEPFLHLARRRHHFDRHASGRRADGLGRYAEPLLK